MRLSVLEPRAAMKTSFIFIGVSLGLDLEVRCAFPAIV
jgi:hypothetical protein